MTPPPAAAIATPEHYDTRRLDDQQSTTPGTDLMPRFQTDDTFGDCLEAKRAGTAALGLYYLCGLWCARYLTDGHIPSEVAASYGTAEWARKLVDAGLWLAEDGGFLMPRYLDDNPSAEKVRKERQAKAERQAKWLEKARNTSSSQRRVSSASSRPSKNASRDGVRDVAPPLPSPKGEGVGAAPRSGGAAPPTHAQDPASLTTDWRQPPEPGTPPAEDLAELRRQLRGNAPPRAAPKRAATPAAQAGPQPTAEQYAAAKAVLEAIPPEDADAAMVDAVVELGQGGHDPSPQEIAVRAAEIARRT